MSDNQTGQVDDPKLSEAFEEREQTDALNMTIAQRLAVASAEREFSYDYLGVPIKARVPTAKECDDLIRTYTAITSGASTDVKADLDHVRSVVAELTEDESINLEFLQSGTVGHSFLQEFIFFARKADLEHSEAVKNFRIL